MPEIHPKHYVVIIDAPDAVRAYGVKVTEVSEKKAKIAAAKRVIRADPRGCGPNRHILSHMERRVLARQEDFVRSVAEHATVAELI